MLFFWKIKMHIEWYTEGVDIDINFLKGSFTPHLSRIITSVKFDKFPDNAISGRRCPDGSVCRKKRKEERLNNIQRDSVAPLSLRAYSL